MLKKIIILFIAVWSVFQPQIFCQPYYFRHYEVESGLSNNAVMCSVQDKTGFMWFGTRDGINRFDGYTFKVYRFNNNKNSGNNLIHALQVDAAGLLLAATEKEIYQYNARLDSFILLVSSKYFPIDKIVTDHTGSIWFNASGILNRFSQNSRQLTVYEPSEFFYASGLSVDKNGTLWVATPDGYLKKYNKSYNSFASFNVFEYPDNNKGKYIHTILCTDDGKILIGGNKADFKIFNINSGSYINVPLCCVRTEDLFIRSFLQVSPTETWIGTESGIFIYDSKTGSSKKIQKESNDPYALSDNVIYTLFKDKEEGIWVGTYFGGISYYPKQFTPFQKFYYKPFENSLSGNIVREIQKDRWDNLWIGTEDGGLNKLEAKTGKFIHYLPGSKPKSISYICAHNLLALDNELWVGTYEHGLDILDLNTGALQRHYGASTQNGLLSNFPFCSFKTKEGEIIIGSTNGIYTYNKGRDYFEPIPGLPSSGLYANVIKDENNTIWGAMPGKGVYYVNVKTGISGNFRFNPFDSTSLSSDKVNSIFEGSDKTLWFATENGLCKWNPTQQNFTRYSTRNGLPSDFILSLLEDEKGNLWISTTRGLVRFNPENGNVQVYTTTNGLLSDQFNFSSAFKDENGNMYFGSAKGLIRFHPSSFSLDQFVPPVYVTGLQINNQEITIAPKSSPLKQSLIYTDKIILNHDQSTFSLDFAALGYTAPQNLQYAYQLAGLSNNWTYVKGGRKAHFTKLKPGSYIFKIKVSSSSGIWNNKETALVIEILPPWWASPWAFIIYTLLSIGLIYYLFSSYHKRVEEKNKRKIALLEIAKEKEMLQLEIAKEKEMLESKIDFFTNIAHEIKTPLTLLKVPLATVIEKTAGMPIVDRCLKIMENNTDRLTELSNQLLDFRKTEIDGYSLSKEKININNLISDIHTNFISLAEQGNINVKIALPAKPLYALVDVEAFKKIIYNLFSNAIKYARSTVHITLQPGYKNEHTFTLIIENNGYLVPIHLKEKIFEPFYRIKETGAKKGTGIGLALARSLAQLHNGELHFEQSPQGTNVFSLTLPIDNTVKTQQ